MLNQRADLYLATVRLRKMVRRPRKINHRARQTTVFGVSIPAAILILGLQIALLGLVIITG